MKNKLLRKVGILVLAGAMVCSLCLSGCRNSGTATDTATGTDSTETDASVSSSENEGDTEKTDEETNYITMEYEYYSDKEEDLNFDIPQVIEQSGKKYRFTGEAEYTTSEIMNVIATILDVEVEEKEDVDKEIEFVGKNGKKYKLRADLFNWSELTTINTKVEEKVDYGPRTSAPEIPKEKDITYYNEVSQKDETIKGTLVDSGASNPSWQAGYPVEGEFYCTGSDVDVWTIEGFKDVSVSQSAETPVWEGYQTDILNILSLDASKYRVTGAAWNGEAWEEGGMLYRKATYNCEASVSSYWAVYTGTGQAYGYKAKLFYYLLADELEAAEKDKEDISILYRMRAVAKYEEITE